MPAQHISSPTRASTLLSEMFTRQQLAVELQLTCDTLCRWETRQIGPPCTRIGRRVFYRRDAVESWLRAQDVNQHAKVTHLGGL
jgi:hypothetical protein